MGNPIEFPVALHVRCTAAMLEEVKARGGGRWLRALITANIRPPVPHTPAPVPQAAKILVERGARGTPRSKRAK